MPTKPSKAKPTAPGKPYPDFPLWAHPNGQWCKKIAGAPCYFGVWADPEAALQDYLNRKDYLYAGLTPPPESIKLDDVLKAFEEAKTRAVDEERLTQRSFDEYKDVWEIIRKELGGHRNVEHIAGADLERLRNRLARGKSGQLIRPSSLKRLLTMARMPFVYANEEYGCAIRYKKALASPTAKQIRKARNEIGERLFEADEIRKLLKAAKPKLKAMIYLGINCGFGNRDCATLPIEHVDLARGWHTYPRPKTEIRRRCPLWPETVAALRVAVGKRDSGNVFMTKYGSTWVGEGRACPISYEFRKLLVKLDLYRDGVTTFYTLRRTFETIGETANQPKALQYIMGHAPATTDMSAIYRQKTFDGPLKAVTDRVRSWLLGKIKL